MLRSFHDSRAITPHLGATRQCVAIAMHNKKELGARTPFQFLTRRLWELNYDVVKVAKRRSTARGHRRRIKRHREDPRAKI